MNEVITLDNTSQITLLAASHFKCRMTHTVISIHITTQDSRLKLLLNNYVANIHANSFPNVKEIIFTSLECELYETTFNENIKHLMGGRIHT